MSDSSVQKNDWVVLARLKRPQGRKGEISAEILTDFPERFEERRRLFLLPAKGEARPVEVESHWFHKGGVILKFDGVDSIDQAEQLRGLEVAIPQAERVPLDEDSFYISDLVGCSLYSVTPEASSLLGKIVDVDRESTEVDLLVIQKGKEELLVPFVKAYLRKADISGKRLEMELPEGLLQVNAPATAEEKEELKQNGGE